MPRSTRSVRHPLRLPDLQADPHNANRGTDRGRAALAQSLRDHGAGRAVLIDRHGRIIAGNKTVEQRNDSTSRSASSTRTGAI